MPVTPVAGVPPQNILSNSHPVYESYLPPSGMVLGLTKRNFYKGNGQIILAAVAVILLIVIFFLLEVGGSYIPRVDANSVVIPSAFH